MKRDVFAHKSSCIVENHIQQCGEDTALGGILKPDRLKDAIAAELRQTWNDALEVAIKKIVEQRSERERVDPRDPDPLRSGIFRDHNCWKCSDGAKPCANGNPRQCEYPHARND